MQYKAGDKVVRIVNGTYYKRGDKAEIVSKFDAALRDDYTVLFNDKHVIWNTHFFVLEEIFNSPLAQLMSEEE